MYRVHVQENMYLVSIELYKHEWTEVLENEKCCGNTSRRQVFPQLFRVLPNFHKCFYNLIETWYMFSISLRKHRDEKKENNLLTLIIKISANSLCSHHHYVNSAR